MPEPAAPPSSSPPAQPVEVDLSAAGRAAQAQAPFGQTEPLSEIITTPPPRALRTLLYALIGLCGLIVAWAYFSQYDVVVVERGELAPVAPVGVIQADSAVRVERILAEEGAQVTQGQPVLAVTRPGNEQGVTLTAPIAGTLGGIVDRRVGELAAPGQRLAEVVPPGPLMARIRIANQDMGRVQPGRAVKVKVDAFPYQEYGALEGKLATIATVPSTPSAGPAGAPGSMASGPPGYDAEVALDQTDAKMARLRERLRPGLALSAEIVVTRRRILDLLLDKFRSRGSTT